MTDAGDADRMSNVPFIRPGDSAHLILAERILARYGGGRFRAVSDGGRTKGAARPFAPETLENDGGQDKNFRSKSLEAFARLGAPVMDFAFAICRDEAGATCLVWPDEPMTAQRGAEEQAAIKGSISPRASAT